MKHKIVKRCWILLAFLYNAGWQCILYAQTSGGSEAFNSATTEVKSYYTPVKQLVWVIAAVLGLVGGLKLYNKFTNSDPESSKHATAFVGGAIALYVGEIVVRKMFLES